MLLDDVKFRLVVGLWKGKRPFPQKHGRVAKPQPGGSIVYVLNFEVVSQKNKNHLVDRRRVLYTEKEPNQKYKQGLHQP